MKDHVKIRPSTCRVQYVGDAEQSEFGFNFAIFEPNDLDIWVDGTNVRQGVEIRGIRETDGGSVLFAEPPAAGAIITLQRRVAIARYTDFQPSGQFYADTLNEELDRLVAMVQQVDSLASRALRLDVEEPDAALLLPTRSRGLVR